MWVASLLWFASLLRCLNPGPQRTRRDRRRRRQRHRGPHFEPHLEALECRAVPSTFTVANLADSGAGSLRQAILDANAQRREEIAVLPRLLVALADSAPHRPAHEKDVAQEQTDPAQRTDARNGEYVPLGQPQRGPQLSLDGRKDASRNKSSDAQHQPHQHHPANPPQSAESIGVGRQDERPA